MEYKAVPAGIPLVDDDRTVRQVVSVFGNLDQVGDRITKGAFTKTIAERLPRGDIKALWQHDMSQPPVGTVLNLEEIGRNDLSAQTRDQYADATGGLLATIRYLNTARGDEVLTGIKNGALTQNSIGFDVIKWDWIPGDKNEDPIFAGRELKELRLWDVSAVNYGANDATHNLKAAIPFKAASAMPEDTAWDGAAVMAACEGAVQLRRVCAWVDPDGDPDAKGSYKFPHHEAGGDVVWKGVAAAMGALMGARTPASIPDADRQGVYDHLSKHYEALGKTPPDFKTLELGYLTSSLEPEAFKAGRVLSQANLTALKEAIDTLNRILTAAEPPADEAAEALTAATAYAVLARLAIAQREFVAA